MIRKIHLLFFVGIILSFSVISQPSNTTELEDSKNEDLVGYITRKEIQSGDFGIHFKKYYSGYNPDQVILNELKTKVYACEIKLVMASWCHDSQTQVPRFYKILDKLDYNTNTIKIISLDREKSAEGIDISALNIELVPTIIFYQGKQEIGRIIETPEASLEEDALKILNDYN